MDFKTGTPLLDTKTKKDLTPGLYKLEYGTVNNIRWWWFGYDRKPYIEKVKTKP